MGIFQQPAHLFVPLVLGLGAAVVAISVRDLTGRICAQWSASLLIALTFALSGTPFLGFLVASVSTAQCLVMFLIGRRLKEHFSAARRGLVGAVLVACLTIFSGLTGQLLKDRAPEPEKLGELGQALSGEYGLALVLMGLVAIVASLGVGVVSILERRKG